MMNGIRSIKRGLAVLLSACLVFGMTPVQAGAEETTQGNELHAENDHYQNGFCVNGKVENGIYVHDADCSYGGCCGYEPAVLKEKVTFYDTFKGKDVKLPSAYEIANAGQLYWFAGVVNGDENVCKGGVPKNTRVNAILTADITINQNVLTTDGQLNEADKSSFLKWTPIGGDGNTFYGAINGNHHVIRGLYADEDRDYVGLIGKSNTYVSYSGGNYYCVSVEQLGIEDSYIKGNNYVGALAGLSYASVYACYNTGTVVAAGKYAGGIQGKFISNSTYCDFTYCYNRGSVTGADYVGGITGSFAGSMVRMWNCYNTGRVSGKKDNVHMIAGWVDAVSEARISDCYYDNSSGADDTCATGLNAEAFASGEAAYLLNIYNKKKQTIRFRQTIGEDSYPVLAQGSKEVYAQAVINCDGTPSEESRYTNEQIDESVQYTAHKIDAFGICTICGKYAEPQLSADGYYEITNAGELYWFAEQVNGGMYALKARIMKDIVVNEGTFTQDADGNLLYNGKAISDSNKPREWTPIGENRNSYSGTIDGQYHTISGLYNGQCEYYAGFIGECGGTVRNLGVINSCFVKASGYSGVGGIAGRIGYSGKLYNCYFQGILIMPTGSQTYGLIGEAKATSDNSCIRNCYYCTNSQNIQSYQGIEAVSAEALASGEAAWRLNQNNVTYKYSNGKDPWIKDSKMVWGQVLTGENQTSYPSAYQESLGNAVYRNVSKYKVCEHVNEPTDYADEKNANRVIEYSFGNTQTKPEFVIQFQWNENEEGKHVCSVCGSEQEHENVYSVEEDNHKITASCLYDSSEDRGSLMITAPEYPEGEKAVTYDGSAKDVKVKNTIEGVKPKVIYTYQADGSDTTETLSEGVKPMNAGSYTASVSLTGADNNTATVSVTFTIEQATPTIAWAEDQTKQSVAYTGDEIDSSKLTAPTVTLLSDDTFSDNSKITYSYRKVTDGTASGDFKSGLPADIGTYEIKASIPADGNYTAAEGTMTLEIKWLDLDNIAATLKDKNGKTLDPATEWWATSVSFTAPEGYTICKTVDGTYGSSFTYADATGDEAKEITYYLKNETGEIGEKSVTVRIVDPDNCSHVDKKGTDSEGNETNEPDGFCDKCGTSLKDLEHLAELYRTISNELNNSEGKYNGTQYTTKSIENLRQALKTAGSMTAQNSVDEITTAYDNLLKASRVGKDGLIAADRNIVISFANSGAVRGIASGNGWYANGDTVTLKVTPSVGYIFSKWTTDTEGKTSVGTESTYTFTLGADSPAVYHAWLDEVKYTVTCESVEGGTGKASEEQYVYGQTATVTATANDDYEFVGWKDSYGTTVSKDATYSFTVLGDATLKPEFVKVKTEEGAAISYVTVSFYHQSGKLLDSQKVVSGEGKITTTVNAPTKVGFDFLGWSAKASGAIAEDVVDFGTATFSENTSLYPVFKAQDITYTLKVGLQTEQKAPQSSVTVIADPMEGKQFVGWKDANGNIVSYDSTYTFIITGDTTLTACYEQVDSEVVKEPTIVIGEPTYEDITGGYKMAFYFNYTVPEDCKLVDIGIIRKKGDYEADGITLETVGISQYSVLSKLGSEGQFYYTKSNYYGTGHTVTGYMIYEKNGIRYTVYSDSIYGVKNN